MSDEDRLRLGNIAQERAAKRAAKHFGKDSFFQPINQNDLSEAGKALRKRLAEVNKNEPVEVSLTDQLIQYIRKGIPSNKRRQIVPFDVAKAVVAEIFEREEDRKNKPAIFTPEQQIVIDDITRYFIGDPASPYEHHKGLFLYGKFGVGKDHIFRAMWWLCDAAKMNEMVFDEVPSKMYTEDFIDYKENRSSLNPLKKYGRGSLLIKDLGEEQQQVKSYSNLVHPIDLLLSERNEAFDRYCQRTHVSSNLGLSESGTQDDDEKLLIEQLAALYGPRVLDRFFDQFETVRIPGDSKRG